MKKLKLLTNILASLLFSSYCSAQVIPGSEAIQLRTKSAVDPNGIDLISGSELVTGVNLSIGNSQSGISITDSSFNGMRIEYKGTISYIQSVPSGSTYGCELLPAGHFLSVSTSSGHSVFQYFSGSDTPVLVRGKGFLKWGTDSALFRDLDGTEYKFEYFSSSEEYSASVGNVGSCQFRKTIATLTKISKPNGEIIDINYKKSGVIELPLLGTTTFGYFTSVQSSLGWLFKRETISEVGVSTSPGGKRTVRDAFFLNLSNEYCNADGSTACNNISSVWPRFKLTETYASTSSSVSYDATMENSLSKVTKAKFTCSLSAADVFVEVDKIVESPMGLKRVYTRLANGAEPYFDRCDNVDVRKIRKYSLGGTVFNYQYRSMESSEYANSYTIPYESTGPYGKVRFVPALSQYPFYSIDNLSRTYVTGHASNVRFLLQDVGYLNDSMTTAGYDSRGNITSIAQKSKVEGEASLVTTLHYPDESTCATTPKICNKPDWITDQNGVTTTYSYHAQSGNVETITKPAVNGIQAQSRYKYEQKTPYVKNSSGSLVANPPVWVLTEVSECMTQTLNTCVGTLDEKRIVYSDFTNNLLPQKMTVQNGNESIKLVTATEYDIYGNVVAVDGPRAGTDDKVFFFYDLMRQKVGEVGVDPDGSGPLPRQAVKTIYNDDGKVTSVSKGITFGTTKADLDAMTVKQQATTEYSTDHGLPIVERFYAAGVLEKITQKSYDNKLRLDCVAQRLNRNAWSALPTSACTLGAAGLEGNDRITKYNYDAANAVLSTISGYGTPLQRIDRTNTYSPVNGLLTSEADGKGNTTAYKYDNYNRLFKTVYPTPANGAVESTTDYTQTNYKPGSGLVDSVRLRDGLTINFSEYDELGRVKTKSGALSESFTYNNFNQVLTHTNNSTGGVSQTSTYIFNPLGWLKSESRVAGGVSLGSVSYGYDAFGRRTSLTWPDTFTVLYDYKVNGVESEYLRKITESNGTLLARFDYYDNGRRKSLTRGNGVVTAYGYNELDQLRIQLTDVGGVNPADDILEEFRYTVSGQLKTHFLTVINSNYIYAPTIAAAINYTPDALNRIANVNGASFGYDGRGNLTSDNTGASYAYNANNLLLNATTGGVATTLSYDAENRLHSVTKSGNTTKFVYDGTDLIAETNASNTIQRRYVHGPETDDPIVWYEGSGTTDKRYYTANRQGSIVGVTLQNGLSTSVNAYDEYGIQKLNTIGRFQYTGQTWIPEIGLYYYKARFYSPTLGRFMQTDPVGYKDGMNWYAYVGNDPVNKTDPTGMYGRGAGFTDDQWKKFDKAQQAAAKSMDKTASNLNAKADKLDAKGKSGGDALREKAGHLSAGAAALKSNGSDGKIANGFSKEEYAKLPKSTANGAASAPVGGSSMNVNLGAKIWTTNQNVQTQQQWVVGHESLHTAGLYHQYFNEQIGYKFGSPEQQKAFEALEGTTNPDNLMQLVYPNF